VVKVSWHCNGCSKNSRHQHWSKNLRAEYAQVEPDTKLRLAYQQQIHVPAGVDRSQGTASWSTDRAMLLGAGICFRKQSQVGLLKDYNQAAAG
jgi:hypothetical protein